MTESPQALLWDCPRIAQALDTSTRTIWRMKDAGKLPSHVGVGRLVKWRRTDIEEWVEAGCPDCRATGWTPASDVARPVAPRQIRRVY